MTNEEIKTLIAKINAAEAKQLERLGQLYSAMIGSRSVKVGGDQRWGVSSPKNEGAWLNERNRISREVSEFHE